MKRRTSAAERMFLEEVSHAAQVLERKLHRLSLGESIGLIRRQLGMSQKALAQRSHITQAMVSKIEQGKNLSTISNLKKILDALSCDLVLAPRLRQPIDIIRQKQATLVAKKRIQYLQGTMNLEKQEPNQVLVEKMIKQKTEELLHRRNSRLWEE